MDGIRARIKVRFSKRKSSGFVSTSRENTIEDRVDGDREQRASPGHFQAVGERSQPNSVVETACNNSQQPAHHAEPAASVTTTSTGDSDARTVTTAPSTCRPRQNPHDTRLKGFHIGGSYPGVTLDR